MEPNRQARLWWEMLKKEEKTQILENDDPLEAILMALPMNFWELFPLTVNIMPKCL